MSPDLARLLAPQVDPQLAETIRGKRDYFFSGLDPAVRDQIMLDEEASYSVTEQGLAEESSGEFTHSLD